VGVRHWTSGIQKASSVSGDILLSDEGGVAVRLVTALATLTSHVRPGGFALIGGLAVMTRLGSIHRVTDDIDGVCEQRGDDPSDIAIVLGETGRGGIRRLIDGVKIDHIDVSDTPAAQIPRKDLPDDEWDRAFVLVAHRWGLDAASPVTISAVGEGAVVATVTCLAASAASLVTMKLLSAPRRPVARVQKAANDYLDLQRLLSNVELVPSWPMISSEAPPTSSVDGPSSGSVWISSTGPTRRPGLSDEPARPTNWVPMRSRPPARRS
jgi:hypothetical protein